jgi:hypothetical protein
VLDVFVDGDACPVKAEVYRVALRHDLKVYVVFCGVLRAEAPGRVEFVRVRQGADAADDWIAEQAGEGDLVVTADILLASRVLARGARVVTPDGRALTAESIGDAVANRALMDHLRQMGEITGGPAPFTRADRSRFLARLEETIQVVRRESAGGDPTGRNP